MKLFLDIKKMDFEEEDNLIEHDIILGISDIEFYGYDRVIELPDDDKFIKDILNVIYKKDKDNNNTEEIEEKQFIVRENKTWWGFPLYEIIDNKIVSFDYTKYNYFANTDRRVALADKINEVYNPSAELKILRETISFIMDKLKLTYPSNYNKMNIKINEIINKSPKEKTK